MPYIARPTSSGMTFLLYLLLAILPGTLLGLFFGLKAYRYSRAYWERYLSQQPAETARPQDYFMFLPPSEDPELQALKQRFDRAQRFIWIAAGTTLLLELVGIWWLG
jgi:hypothetical protein